MTAHLADELVVAHEVTTPDARQFVSLSGALAYDPARGYSVTPVRGYHCSDGCGFVIVDRTGYRQEGG